MSILFATPCYGGMVTAQFWKSSVGLQVELHSAGIQNDWLIRWNESLVHRARMGMAAVTMKNAPRLRASFGSPVFTFSEPRPESFAHSRPAVSM